MPTKNTMQRLRIIAAGCLALLASVGGGTAAERGVAGLPYAEGKTFTTLDAYLAHLKALAPIGVPHYEEVAPGTYERQLQRVLPGQKRPRLTRAELERELGFSR